MADRQITIPYTQASYEELSAADRYLVDQARSATQRSYAPYSRFHVGAAIRLDDGTIVTGANQENAAFPSGTCAERTACFYAHASHPDTPFNTIAIAARQEGGAEEIASPISPCGACRQALLEYEMLAGHPVRLILVGRDYVYIIPSVKSLLPFAFTEF